VFTNGELPVNIPKVTVDQLEANHSFEESMTEEKRNQERTKTAAIMHLAFKKDREVYQELHYGDPYQVRISWIYQPFYAA